MSVVVAVARAAASQGTPTYTQDITTADCGGLTPKAAILIMSSAVTDGTPAAHAHLSMGFTDGTRELCIVSASQDNLAKTSVATTTDSDRLVRFNLAGGAEDGAAQFNSFITNGIRLDWVDSPADNYLITAIFFCGTDLVNAYCNYKDLGDTVDNAVDITDPGFQPEVVFFMSGDGISIDAGLSQLEISFGVAVDDGSDTQRSVIHLQRQNAASSQCHGSYRNDAVCGSMISQIAAAFDWWGELGTFDANGFTITTRNDGANGTDLMYLALDFNGAVGLKVGDHVTPTGTPPLDDSETFPTFTPQAVILGISHLEVVNTANRDDPAGSYGLAAFTDSAEFSTTNQDEDNAADTNTQSIADDTAINAPMDDGSSGLVAAYKSMDANGFTLTYSTVTANAKYIWALAIEEEAGEPILEGTATLAGVGTLAANGDTVAAANATLAGVGTVVAAGTNARFGTSTLAGVGSLTAAGSNARLGTSTLAGVGTLVADGYRAELGTTTLPGVGTLTAAGENTRFATATLPGVGTLAAVGTLVPSGVTQEGTATLPGAATLSAVGENARLATSTLPGVGTLAAVGSRIGAGGTTLPGVCTLVAAGTLVTDAILGTATLAGVVSLSAVGTGSLSGTTTLSGVGSLAALGENTRFVAATLAGVGSLTAAGSNTRFVTTTLSGVATVQAAGESARFGLVTMAGVGTVVADAQLLANATATLPGVGTLQAIGTLITTYYGTVTLSCIGILQAIGTLLPTTPAKVGGDDEREKPKQYEYQKEFLDIEPVARPLDPAFAMRQEQQSVMKANAVAESLMRQNEAEAARRVSAMLAREKVDQDRADRRRASSLHNLAKAQMAKEAKAKRQAEINKVRKKSLKKARAAKKRKAKKRK